ncbi:MAG: TRAP transporter substrate-binding protein [Rhodobacteraceae bacterium]|nr:TRAP transporter substrate-binding protein [Paracoccaceae bacterium]
MTRRTALGLLGAAVATPAYLRRAQAAEVTLRLSHFLPAVSSMQTKFFEPWAAELSEASGGRIEVQIFPSMTLGGKPPQLADQARNGIADIAWTLPVYTPDRFPVAETMSLPFMVTDATRSSVAMEKLMSEYGQKEYRGMKPLAFHTHAGGKFHMRDKVVTSGADLKGLRIRSPNQSFGELLKLLEVEPVFFPVTEMAVGLTNGVIDGCCLPYEVVPAFKLQELTHEHSAPAPAARGLYSNTFALVMNQRTFDRLAPDLQEIIDAQAGAPLSRRIGELFDWSEQVGLEAVEASGGGIHEIPAEEIAAWKDLSAPIYDAWAAKLDKAGLDGTAILARANDLLDQTTA